MDQRNVTIGRDAFGNAIVTGDNNVTVLLISPDKIPADILAALNSGRLKPADIPGAVILPALTLAIEYNEARDQWTIRACRASGTPTERTITAPDGDAAVAAALDTFRRLSRKRIETKQDADSLDAAAIRIGDALAQVLTSDETAFLNDAARSDPPPPLLVIESEHEAIPGLPWELLRPDGKFAVRDGHLDVARSVTAPHAPELAPPTAPISLLVTVAAPEGSGLDYERETFFIVRALQEHVGVVINEMGEVGDLIDGLRRADPPPIGVHFSGHGGPGALFFENEFGENHAVKVDDLLATIRRHVPDRLPRFFFLACCHGGDAPSVGETGDGLRSVATALHRDGIAQVVGYFGPVLDELSTRAERAFYAELADGRRTRDGVRLARAAMAEAQAVIGRSRPRDAAGMSPGGTLPYAWAQMVLFQSGPDHPLGTKIKAGPRIAAETTERRAETAYPGSRTRVLKAGFVGRRKEMHALRRDLREARHLHVVQGTGGLGKSTFCIEALKVYASLGWQPLVLWCVDVKADPDPISGLLRQLETGIRELMGNSGDRLLTALEGEAVRDPRLRQPPARLLRLLQAMLQAQPSPLVLYLDDLELLQIGPDDDSADQFADWRDAGCAALWQGLRDLQRQQPGRFAVLASARYRHKGFGAVVPFERLPDDALWRMLPWFPGLRRLSEDNRITLVRRLAGHPRSVEFLDVLIESAILDWESRHGPFKPGCLSAADELAQIIGVTLPTLDRQLSEDLLFEALWDRVLDPTARDLLVRVGVLRQPGPRTLIEALAGPGDGAAIGLLCRSGLLTEIRENDQGGVPAMRYEVHPSVARLANRRSRDVQSLLLDGHRRAGDYLETVAATSPSWQDNIEGAYHLRQVGETDRAWDLVGSLIEGLQDSGRIQASLTLLADFDDTAALHAGRAAHVYSLRGSGAVAYGNLPAALTSYQASLGIAERLAKADPDNAGWQRDLSVSHNKIGDVQVAQGNLPAALTSYQASLGIRERLARADPDNAGWQRDLSVSRDKIGDVQVAQGNLPAALTSYQASHDIFERLARADPGNAGWQRDLSVSHEKIGDVQVAQGNLPAALTSYQASLGIRERLARADPDNAGWQRDLSVSRDKIGDVQVAQGNLPAALTSYQASHDIFERLARADTGNAGWQRDLSVSHDNIGDVQVAQGDLPAALTSYQASHDIFERLARADTGNAGWQRDLSVSHDNIGDVQVAQGNLPAALTSYQASLGIRERLARADPGNAGWQRDLSVSHNKIGDVQVAQGNLPAALTSYQASHDIFERLARADTGNAGWQRDLSVSHNKIGNVQVAQGNLPAALTSYQASLGIRERLARADTGNAGWQRDLSVSHNKIGDVQVAQGNLPAALTSYQASHDIFERLALADPGNAGWQRDLSVSHNNIGDVQVAQGNLPVALTSYQASHDIFERLARADPGNAGWQRDLSVSHNNIGDVQVAQGNLPAALTSYQASHDIFERLARADPAMPVGSATCRCRTTTSATCRWRRAICRRR